MRYSGRGKNGHPKYGCPQNFYRRACSNNLKEGADWLEDRLLSELQAAVMEPEAVEYAIGEFQRQLTASMNDLSTQLGRIRERTGQLEAELRNLIALAASSGHSPALVEAINEREQEVKNTKRQLLTAETDSVSA